jgi:hypothetical protein
VQEFMLENESHLKFSCHQNWPYQSKNDLIIWQNYLWMTWGEIVINCDCFIGTIFHFVLTKNLFCYFVEILHFIVGGNIIGYNFVKNLMDVSIIKGIRNHLESQWKQSNFVYMFMHWHFKIMLNMGNRVKWLIWMLKSSKYNFI